MDPSLNDSVSSSVKAGGTVFSKLQQTPLSLALKILEAIASVPSRSKESCLLSSQLMNNAARNLRVTNDPRITIDPNILSQVQQTIETLFVKQGLRAPTSAENYRNMRNFLDNCYAENTSLAVINAALKVLLESQVISYEKYCELIGYIFNYYAGVHNIESEEIYSLAKTIQEYRFDLNAANHWEFARLAQQVIIAIKAQQEAQRNEPNFHNDSQNLSGFNESLLNESFSSNVPTDHDPLHANLTLQNPDINISLKSTDSTHSRSEKHSLPPKEAPVTLDKIFGEVDLNLQRLLLEVGGGSAQEPPLDLESLLAELENSQSAVPADHSDLVAHSTPVSTPVKNKTVVSATSTEVTPRASTTDTSDDNSRNTPVQEDDSQSKTSPNRKEEGANDSEEHPEFSSSAKNVNNDYGNIFIENLPTTLVFFSKNPILPENMTNEDWRFGFEAPPEAHHIEDTSVDHQIEKAPEGYSGQLPAGLCFNYVSAY